MVLHLQSRLITPSWSCRFGPAGLHYGRGSQHPWRHCLPQVIPGSRPHELRPWLGIWGGAEVLPHLRQMASRARRRRRRRGEVRRQRWEEIKRPDQRLEREDKETEMSRQPAGGCRDCSLGGPLPAGLHIQSEEEERKWGGGDALATSQCCHFEMEEKKGTGSATAFIMEIWNQDCEMNFFHFL